MHLKNQKDFFSGLLFMGMGIAFAWTASRYPIGTAAQMGPGYFPLLLGALLTLLGVSVVFKALVIETEDGGRIGRWAWRPLAAVVLAHCAFGLLLGGLPTAGLPPMGLVLAVLVSTAIASRAVAGFRWREVLALALLLALLSALVCVELLQWQLALWPAFATP